MFNLSGKNCLKTLYIFCSSNRKFKNKNFLFPSKLWCTISELRSSIAIKRCSFWTHSFTSDPLSLKEEKLITNTKLSCAKKIIKNLKRSNLQGKYKSNPVITMRIRREIKKLYPRNQSLNFYPFIFDETGPTNISL